MPDNDDVAQMTFEKALQDLEGIVNRLERGEVPLAESIAIYERGDALRKHCSRLLAEAEARVERIRLNADGKPIGTAPLDPE
jgi:exodeoxyribonuclease VII small subunit